MLMSAVKITCQLIAGTENLLGHFDQSQTRIKFEYNTLDEKRNLPKICQVQICCKYEICKALHLVQRW